MHAVLWYASAGPQGEREGGAGRRRTDLAQGEGDALRPGAVEQACQSPYRKTKAAVAASAVAGPARTEGLFRRLPVSRATSAHHSCAAKIVSSGTGMPSMRANVEESRNQAEASGRLQVRSSAFESCVEARRQDPSAALGRLRGCAHDAEPHYAVSLHESSILSHAAGEIEARVRGRGRSTNGEEAEGQRGVRGGKALVRPVHSSALIRRARNKSKKVKSSERLCDDLRPVDGATREGNLVRTLHLARSHLLLERSVLSHS